MSSPAVQLAIQTSPEGEPELPLAQAKGTLSDFDKLLANINDQCFRFLEESERGRDPTDAEFIAKMSAARKAAIKDTAKLIATITKKHAPREPSTQIDLPVLDNGEKAKRDAKRAQIEARATAIQKELSVNEERARKLAESKTALGIETLLEIFLKNPEAEIIEAREYLQTALIAAPQFVSAKQKDIADGMQRMTDEIIEQIKTYAIERRKLLSASSESEKELISSNLARMSSLFKNLVAKIISDFEREKRGQPGSPTMRRTTSEFAIPMRPTGPIGPVSAPKVPPAAPMPKVSDYTEADVGDVVDGIFERITTGATIPMGFEGAEGRSFITGLMPVDQRPSENPKPTREVSEPLIADPFADDEGELPADMHAAGSDAFEGFEIPSNVVFADNAPQLPPRHRADPFDPATFPPLAAPTPLPKAVKLPSTFPPLPTLPRKPKA